MAATVGPAATRSWPVRSPPRSTPTLGAGAAHDAAAPASREARGRRTSLREVLAGRTDVDVDTLLAASPDTGEAGAQVDAVLADHARLTEGTE